MAVFRATAVLSLPAATQVRTRQWLGTAIGVGMRSSLVDSVVDRRVPPAQGENLHRARNERSIDHEWIYHVNEGHGFYDVSHRVEMYEKILAFLDRSIGSNQNVVPSK